MTNALSISRVAEYPVNEILIDSEIRHLIFSPPGVADDPFAVFRYLDAEESAHPNTGMVFLCSHLHLLFR